MAPMVVPIGLSPLAPIAIAIGDHWIHYISISEPMDPLEGDILFTITTQSEWIIWNYNGTSGDNGTNSDSFATKVTVAPMTAVVSLVTILIAFHRRQWRKRLFKEIIILIYGQW